MARVKTPIPAIDGWFDTEPEPHLLGLRCGACSTVVFPPDALGCPNPSCGSEALERVVLGRRGTVWSWSVNHYAPPKPYMAPDPFVPYTVVAVELPEEQIVVLGQLSTEADPAGLAVGAEVEVTVETLFADDEHEHRVWRWRPVG
jgi:uncharacterized OB-fold protein